MRLSSVRRGVLPLLALLALPAYAGAQQEVPLFTWTGRVDREVRLSVQGGNVSSNAVRGEEYRGRFRVANALPAGDAQVRVVVTGGRGEVTVMQQPSAQNNYTAVVRVVDRSSGADRYQVTAYYTAGNAGRWARGGASNRVDDGVNRNNGSWNDGRTVEPTVLHWSGLVDANAEVRWQAGSVRQRALDGQPLRSVRSSVTGNVRNIRGRRARAQGTTATVQVAEGRGEVQVIQQPSAANNYTTIVRITDPQNSYGRYRFDVTVQ